MSSLCYGHRKVCSTESRLTHTMWSVEQLSVQPTHSWITSGARQWLVEQLCTATRDRRFMPYCPLEDDHIPSKGRRYLSYAISMGRWSNAWTYADIQGTDDCCFTVPWKMISSNSVLLLGTDDSCPNVLYKIIIFPLREEDTFPML